MIDYFPALYLKRPVSFISDYELFEFMRVVPNTRTILSYSIYYCQVPAQLFFDQSVLEPTYHKSWFVRKIFLEFANYSNHRGGSIILDVLANFALPRLFIF